MGPVKCPHCGYMAIEPLDSPPESWRSHLPQLPSILGTIVLLATIGDARQRYHTWSQVSYWTYGVLALGIGLVVAGLVLTHRLKPPRIWADSRRCALCGYVWTPGD